MGSSIKDKKLLYFIDFTSSLQPLPPFHGAGGDSYGGRYRGFGFECRPMARQGRRAYFSSVLRGRYGFSMGMVSLLRPLPYLPFRKAGEHVGYL